MFKRTDTTQPRLVNISPISFYTSWIFAVMNILIGFSLFNNTSANLHYLVVNELLTFHVWGTVFIVTGILIATSLLVNNWQGIRRCMMLGFVLKCFWAVALVFAAFKVGFTQSLAGMALWFSLAAIQAVIIIFFVPKEIIKLANINGITSR